MSWPKVVFSIVLIIFIWKKFPGFTQTIQQTELATRVQNYAIALLKPTPKTVAATNPASPQSQPATNEKTNPKQAAVAPLKTKTDPLQVPVQESCRPVATELDKMLKEQKVGCWL